VRGTLAAEAFVAAVKVDWRTAGLERGDQLLCEYAEKITRAPAECGAADVAALRAAGFSDRAIHDAVQVIAYFNYINRIADALGTDPEDLGPVPAARGTPAK
jgi:uncharacterized peroxidase-related enzyme